MELFENLIQEDRIADIRYINKRYNDWAKNQFPDSNPISSLKGLEREIDETIKDIESLNKFISLDEKDQIEGGFDHLYGNARLEYADCLMYLIDSARRFGLSLDDLFIALEEKLQINLNRQWKINDDKSYSHIK